MNVLFLCTANSCRSILSEALFNHLAPANMHAYSAGSQPKGEVHPQALAALRRAGVSTTGLSSKGTEVHVELVGVGREPRQMQSIGFSDVGNLLVHNMQEHGLLVHDLVML